MTGRPTDGMLMSVSNPVWILDEAETRFLACNKAAQDLLGLTEEGILSLCPTEIGLVFDSRDQVLLDGPTLPLIHVRLFWCATEWSGSRAWAVIARPIGGAAETSSRLLTSE